MARVGKKLFYKIGEVCKIFDVEPHVLRYWESEFTLLRPNKNRAGQRIYRKKDLELIEAIKHLLYDQGFTIAGANQKLLEQSKGDGMPLFQGALKAGERHAIVEIKKEVEAILQLLG